MKYLIYAGIAPGANPTVNELLTKKVDAGGKCGKSTVYQCCGSIFVCKWR